MSDFACWHICMHDLLAGKEIKVKGEEGSFVSGWFHSPFS
jgi:hypothetical protein